MKKTGYRLIMSGIPPFFAQEPLSPEPYGKRSKDLFDRKEAIES